MVEIWGLTTRDQALILLGLAMLFVFWQMLKILFTPEKDYTYEGGTDEEGRFHGLGKLSAMNGDRFEGSFKHGKFHGYGEYTFKRGGGSYKGHFKEGQFCGKGREVYPDGSSFEGEFLEGKRHTTKSTGRLEYANGTIYVGEWREGKKHGKGMMQYTDGEKFEGHFSEGRKHGPGEFRSASGVRTRGEWAHGRLVKKFETTNPRSTKSSPEHATQASTESSTSSSIHSSGSGADAAGTSDSVSVTRADQSDSEPGKVRGLSGDPPVSPKSPKSKARAKSKPKS